MSWWKRLIPRFKAPPCHNLDDPNVALMFGGRRLYTEAQARVLFGSMEPCEAKQCGARYGDPYGQDWTLECTRTTGHDGFHVAHGNDGREIRQWEPTT